MRNHLLVLVFVFIVATIWPLAGSGSDTDPDETERQFALKSLATFISAEAAYYAQHGQYSTVADLNSGSMRYLSPEFPKGQHFGLALGEDGQSYRAVVVSSAGTVYSASEYGRIFAADLPELAQAVMDSGVQPGKQVPFEEY